MSSVLDDLRQSARGFGRAKTATTVLLLSLALGTGANAALYSVIDGLLFRPPAGVVEPSRLVRVFTNQFNGGTYGFTSYPDYLSITEGSSAFQSIAAFDDSQVEVAELGNSRQRVRVTAASPEFFETLGFDPHTGTLPIADEGVSGHAPAVISFALWTTVGRPGDVVGSTLRIGDRPFTVAGITPPRFSGLQLDRICDVWIPLDAEAGQDRGKRRLSLVGRLAEGVDLVRAQQDVLRVSENLARRYPETNRGTRASGDEPRRMTAAGYSRLDPSQRRQVVLISLVVFGATGLLLVSACVNAATMLLSRSAARRRERAVKVALGASRRLLMRQALIESLLITVGGAGLGLLLAHWTAGILPAFFAPEEAEMLDTSLDAVAVTVTIGLSCVAGALFAIGPARHAAKTLDLDVLRADAGGVSEQTGGAAVRTLVVTGQVALSTVVLIAAGLLVQSLTVALEGDLGPAARSVAVTPLKLPGDQAGDVARGITFHTRALEAARKLTGVEAAGWVMTLPVGTSTFHMFQVDVGPGVTETVEVDVNVASGGYFRAMRIPVREGRSFTEEDGALAKPVVIVNDILAQRHFGSRATGRTIVDSEGIEYEIVGVVGTGKYRTFQEPPEPMVYFPHTQRRQGYMQLVVRTAGDAEALLPIIRASLLSIDQGVDISPATTFQDHLLQALVLDRLTTAVVAGCGLAALVLATIGVYGVMADGVRRRTPEIGLRMALGASAPQVVALVFREGLRLTVAGAVAGVVASLLLARIVRAFVHAVPPVNAASLAIVPITLALVVIGAAGPPTIRALRISPG
ncbi:MAG: ABC transporter permease, partial [Vicinamibacterales bacterium]